MQGYLVDFIRAIAALLGNEGGYVVDAGGETWRGISRKWNPKWTGWLLVDKIKAATKNKTNSAFDQALATSPDLEHLVTAFYNDNFWTRFGYERIADSVLRFRVFDAAVNMGPDDSHLYLQWAVNEAMRAQGMKTRIAEDGSLGPMTFTALSSANPSLVLQGFIHRVTLHYLEEAKTQPKNLNGWLSRLGSIA